MTSARTNSGIPGFFDPKEKLARDVTKASRAKRIKNPSTRASVFAVKTPEVEISVDRFTEAGRTAAARTALYRENLNGGDPKFQGWLLIKTQDATACGRQVRYTPLPEEMNEFHSDIVLPSDTITDDNARRRHISRLAELACWEPYP